MIAHRCRRQLGLLRADHYVVTAHLAGSRRQPREPASAAVADLRHGRFALLAPCAPTLVLAPDGRMRTAMVTLVELIAATGASAITTGPGPAPAGSPHQITTTLDLAESLGPIVDAIPLQHLRLRSHARRA